MLYFSCWKHFTGCIPKLREFVRWEDGYGITFTLLVCLGVLVTLATAGMNELLFLLD